MNILLRSLLVFVLICCGFLALSSFRAFLWSWLWPKASSSSSLSMPSWEQLHEERMRRQAAYESDPGIEEYDEEELRGMAEDYYDSDDGYPDYYDYPHYGDL